MGHIASMKAHIAKQLLDSDATRQLTAALQSQDPDMKGAAGWTIEQIANHGTVTAKQMAEEGVLVALEPAYKMLPGKTRYRLSLPAPRAPSSKDAALTETLRCSCVVILRVGGT